MTTLTFKLSVPGKVDKYISETQAAEIYGIRYEQKELQVFTSNAELAEHTIEFTVQKYSDLEPAWILETKVRIAFNDGRCLLTQDEINAVPSMIIKLTSSRAGESVTMPLPSDIFTQAP